MTIPELIERLRWQQEGRLQIITGTGWTDWRDHLGTPQFCDDAAAYRRRHDPPLMPDEVWMTRDGGFALSQHLAPNSVRYVRAGAVMEPDQIEWRTGPNANWIQFASFAQYRIKP